MINYRQSQVYSQSSTISFIYFFFRLAWFTNHFVVLLINCSAINLLQYDLTQICGDRWSGFLYMQLLFTLRTRMLPLLVTEMKIKSISAGMHFHDQIYRHRRVDDSMSRKSKKSTHTTFACHQLQFAELCAEKMCG